MLTETFLRRNERWIKMLTGLTAEEFWALFAQIENDFENYQYERLQRPDRKRAVGAGNSFRHSLLLRVLAVLTYLRLHLTQELAAAWFGMQQYDISRDLRRLLPLIQWHLPVRQVRTHFAPGIGLSHETSGICYSLPSTNRNSGSMSANSLANPSKDKDCLPSDRALIGSGWISIISPSHPHANAALAIGTIMSVRPRECDRSTIMGIGFMRFTRATQAKSSVYRVRGSKVRIPRSHRITCWLPSRNM